MAKMIKNRLSLTSLVLALGIAAPVAAGAQVFNSTGTFTVLDSSGNPVASAQVAAVVFSTSNGNPDPTLTVFGFTNTSGQVTFSPGNADGLAQFYNYMILASSQGYTPGITAQFQNGPLNVTPNPLSVSYGTFTLTSAAYQGLQLGEIDLPFTNATANGMIMGQIGLFSGGGGAVQYALTKANGAGAGTLQLTNVAAAAGNTYMAMAFDPAGNGGHGNGIPPQPVGSAVTGGGVLALGSVNFTSAGQPPVANVQQAQQNAGGANGSLNVSGIVTDTTTNHTPLANVFVQFNGNYQDNYNNNRNDFRGTNTDQNGVFQLYGLLPGVTYYASVTGTCSASSCYAGFQANMNGVQSSVPTLLSQTILSVNGSIVSGSSTSVLNTTIQLPALAPSTGTLAVYITDQFGHAIPQAGLGFWPDGSGWQGAGGGSCTGPYISTPGLVSVNNVQATTGYYLLTGLPSGNYQLNVWTPYGSTNFNNGPDGAPRWGNGGGGSACSGSDTDDLRITVDTTQPTGHDVGVYNQYGVLQYSTSSLNVVVNVSTGSTGLLSGTLTFPGVVNLSSSPILIALNVQCNSGGNCPQAGGFGVFNAVSTGPLVNYSIAVSSGHSYWVNVQSQYWGAVFPSGGQPTVDLTATSSATLNLTFQPAGRVVGTLRKPDGTAYIPPSSFGAPDINADGSGAWGYANLNNDGTFAIGGLLPGNYTLHVQSWAGGFPYTTQIPNPAVTVAANQDVHQDVSMISAVNVLPSLNISKLPVMSPTVCPSNNGNGSCPVDDYDVLALPAGGSLAAGVNSFLISTKGEVSNLFAYSPSTGTVNSYHCDGTYLSAPGFCALPMASNGQTGTSYDFYVLRRGDFDQNNRGGGARPFFVVEYSSKSIPVNGSLATTPLWNQSSNSTSTVEGINLGPAVDLSGTAEAVLAGTVTAVNMINQREFQALGGVFNNFTAYLPQIWVYDSSGSLKGVGVATPYPPLFGLYPALNNNLQAAVAANNWAQFQTLDSAAPPNGWGSLGYEIRGLTAGQTYTVVATSPNYPPYKTSATLGGSGTTTYLNVNLDLNQGSTLSGIVQSTNSAVIVGAQVTVSAPGYSAVTLVTDSAGSWSLSGLSAGQYKVDVVANGYAETAEFVSVGANTTATAATIQMPLGGASISGVVQTTDPDLAKGAVFGIKLSTSQAYPLSGVTVAAYDDTLNAQNPGAPLALVKTVTDSSGSYTLQGLRVGDAYRLFVDQPEYFVATLTTTTVTGNLPGVNFNLIRKPLNVNVFGYVAGSNYEFQITNYKAFSSGNAWIGGSPFTMTGSTNVGNGFQERPDATGTKELFLDYPLSSLTAGTVYTLHVEAQPNDPNKPKVVKELSFGLGLKINTAQAIDETLIGDVSLNANGIPNNQVAVDASGGDPSALSLPAGGVIPTFSTAVPSVSMKSSDASQVPQASSLSTAAVAGNFYSVTLSSVNYASGVDITLKYNQSGSDLNDLAIYTFDAASNKWKSVPGTQTLDPVSGTISIRRLHSLASVLQVSQASSGGLSALAASGPAGARAVGLQALSDGHSYRVNPASLTLRPDDSGVFVILKPSAVGSGSFAGTTVKIYNFPNPFNLQSKVVSLNTTSSNACSTGGLPATVNTNGTVIKYEVPAGISGQGAIRIYTVSGRLVRELDGGDVVGGNCYYTTWDGTNRSGQNVGNGVYYGILTVSGNKAGGSNGTFKMAVIK